jgi:hypothetical protein
VADDRASNEHLQAVRVAKERFADQLKANPDVHGIGVGRRRRGGEKADEYVVVVHVLRKLPEAEVPAARLVPGELRFVTDDGREIVVSTDVQERPRPTPETGDPAPGIDVSSKVRPVPGGMSAGFSGTLGGWVWDIETGQAVALSNRHVFGAVLGSGVTQPSRDDGGSLLGDRIASVVRAGSLDAAIAKPLDPRVVSLSIVGGGPAVFEIADAVMGSEVQKTGRGTGLTRGVVELIDYDSDHHGSHADLWVEGDGVDFSNGGDSGSLYLEADHAGDHGFHRVVGLHWGGAGHDGVGHPIRAVFEDLGVTVLPPAAIPTGHDH